MKHIQLKFQHYLGISIINTNTNEEITTGEYECDSSISYKISIDSSYKYSNLKLLFTFGDSIEIYDVNDTSIEYTIDRLTRNSIIAVHSITDGTDLSLRTFISEINRESPSTSREPITSTTNGDFSYLHTKYPLAVSTEDLITYKIRVYNEGLSDGVATKISMYIPEGLEFVSTNKTNLTYEWEEESDGKITTTYLSDKTISGYSGTLDYEEIEVVLQVTATTSEEDLRFVTICEIEEESETDADSTPGSVTEVASSSYKEDESYNSTESSYIKGYEDDDDFENVVVKGKIKAEYTIKINKIDEETNELLNGAKFNLLDENGNILATEVTADEGYLNFGTFTTYGEGEDIYYIEEASTPEGYVSLEKAKVKITVTKTIVDQDTGEYEISVACELTDYEIDTSRYEYTPIYTIEQLQKIGSGDTISIEGVDYEFNTNSNYKLMNDIDATGYSWTPIEKFEGILDGDGHKISNLTYTTDSSVSTKEIGMFRYVSGVIENLELENVNINITDIADDAEGVTDYSGVGAFAGVMLNGTIRNCTVSGTVTGLTDNIGGFIGHTIPGGIVKLQNCTNNAQVTGGSEDVEVSNVGGLVGCALGALSVTNCTNNGQIVCSKYNVGGLVGYVESTDYEETSVIASYVNDVITITIGNNRTSGQYDLVLETKDAQTLNLIEGAVYTILDDEKETLQDQVTLTNGTLKVATIDIETLGTDTFYIYENETVGEYNKLIGVVKIEVTKYWDEETENYKVTVESTNLSEEEYEDDEATDDVQSSSSGTGSIFTKTETQTISYNSNKASFKSCINNGQIISTYMNAGGIVGTAHCLLSIDDCKNTATVQATGYGKAGGIVSEIYAWDIENYIAIKGCTNSGNVNSEGDYGSASGIVAHSLTNIKITNCTNAGDITAGENSSAAGILSDAAGTIKIDSCTNKGNITADSENDSSYIDYECVAAGILAKNRFGVTYTSRDLSITPKQEDNYTTITNCTNNGNITANHHLGGIVAIITAETVEISDCTVSGTENEKITIYDTYAGDKGGIAGFVCGKKTEIYNCTVEYVDLNRISSVTDNYCGCTAGIIGNLTKWNNGYGYSTIDMFKIMNCKVKNSNIQTKGQETAGILGLTQAQSDSEGYIADCIVEGSTILTEGGTKNITYACSSGILGASYILGTLVIDCNNVENTSIESKSILDSSDGYYDFNAAGILGTAHTTNNVIISNNDVIDSSVTNNSGTSDSNSNAAGIVAAEMQSNSTNISLIYNCKVINTEVTAHSGNLGGILGVDGYINSKSSEVKNCKIENSTLTSDSTTSACSTVGGIVAITWGVEISDCTVTKTKVYQVQDTSATNSGTNTAGILGFSCQTATLDNCNVYDSDIYSTGYYNGHANTAGIAGCTISSITIKNSNVSNTLIEGTRSGDVAGILGSSIGSVSLDNCNVINGTTITSSLTSIDGDNPVTGGMIGYTYNTFTGTNCTVKDVVINAKSNVIAGVIATVYSSSRTNFENVTVRNVTINDNYTDFVYSSSNDNCRSLGGVIGSTPTLNADTINVNNVTINSNAMSAGGIAGFANTVEKLQNCTVDSLTIESINLSSINGSVAGLIGDSTTVTSKITGNTVKNSTFTGYSDNIGGLFGTIKNDVTIEECTVSNVNMENKNTISDKLSMVGGLVAMNLSNITIASSSVKDSSIKISGTETDNLHAGGLIGVSYGATLTDCDVEETTIENSTTGNTGGIVGMSYYYDSTEAEVVISDVNYTGTDSTYIKGAGHVGGIIGFGKLTVSDACNVTEATITGTSTSADVGGVIGNTLSSSSIENVNVTTSSITAGARVGGIAGYGACDISNCTVSGTTITTTGENSEVGGITGSAANSSSEITGCKVESCEITSVNGSNGGIAGFANNTIDSSNVEKTKMTSTGATAYALGGIVGQGSNCNSIKTYINNCSVRGCTISGVNAVGGIAGSSLPIISNCTVVGEITVQGAEDTNYSTTITGNAYVGGLVGDGGKLTDGTYYSVTISDSSLTKIKITGTSFVQNDIGRYSYDETYDGAENTYDTVSATIDGIELIVTVN